MAKARTPKERRRSARRSRRRTTRMLRTRFDSVIARQVLIQTTACRAPEIGIFKHDRSLKEYKQDSRGRWNGKILHAGYHAEVWAFVAKDGKY